MIKSTELRIGNIVTIKGFKNMTIRSISEEQVTIKGIEGKYAVHSEQSIQSIQPVKLTDDLLIKYGFEKKDTNEYSTYFIHQKGIILEYDREMKHYAIYLNNKDIDDSFSDYDANIGIKGLHELQNIFFFYTCEELAQPITNKIKEIDALTKLQKEINISIEELKNTIKQTSN